MKPSWWYVWLAYFLGFWSFIGVMYVSSLIDNYGPIPETVPFTQGMTLQPGQSAVATIDLMEVSALEERAGKAYLNVYDTLYLRGPYYCWVSKDSVVEWVFEEPPKGKSKPGEKP